MDPCSLATNLPDSATTMARPTKSAARKITSVLNFILRNVQDLLNCKCAEDKSLKRSCCLYDAPPKQFKLLGLDLRHHTTQRSSAPLSYQSAPIQKKQNVCRGHAPGPPGLASLEGRGSCFSKNTPRESQGYGWLPAPANAKKYTDCFGYTLQTPRARLAPEFGYCIFKSLGYRALMLIVVCKLFKKIEQ